MKSYASREYSRCSFTLFTFVVVLEISCCLIFLFAFFLFSLLARFLPFFLIPSLFLYAFFFILFPYYLSSFLFFYTFYFIIFIFNSFPYPFSPLCLSLYFFSLSLSFLLLPLTLYLLCLYLSLSNPLSFSLSLPLFFLSLPPLNLFLSHSPCLPISPSPCTSFSLRLLHPVRAPVQPRSDGKKTPGLPAVQLCNPPEASLTHGHSPSCHFRFISFFLSLVYCVSLSLFYLFFLGGLGLGWLV